MEILAFTLVAVNHETPHDRHYRPIDWSSIPIPHLPSGQWIGLMTTALSLAIVMAAPGAIALVRLGDTGSEVSTLQTELQRAGYSIGVDGIFGSGTEAVLIEFQTQNGLVADGIAGPETLAKLQDVNGVVTTSSSAAASPSVLTLGDSGEAVTALQTKLRQLGFFPAGTNVSGFYGEITAEAVRRFQQANSLGVDGIAGPATQARLFGDSPVSQEAATSQVEPASTTATSTTSASQILASGQRSSEVVELQNRLKQLGYLSPSIDSTGFFGSLTLEAVRAFQSRNELAVDGLVGSRTLAILNSDTAIAAAPAASEQTATGGTSAGTAAAGGPATRVDELPPITAGKTITIRTNGGRLNVRSAPNLVSSTIKGSLANGASVEATGIETEGWVEIVDGWVSKDFIEVPQ
ncbi:MAG: peptidoglycan-binding protein [Cyanobacteria bacterium P01_F01_bin.150]